jgi:FkbM family methyltransferase
MKIFYGINKSNLIDVTEICFKELMNNNIITIPSGDSNRSFCFKDPFFRVDKKIFIITKEKAEIYDEFYLIKINITNNEIFSINKNDINQAISTIQSKLKLNYGSFDEELPEQKMAVSYLNGTEKVLEIGGNIGRNTLIISSILMNDSNLVSLECDENIANQLKENRDLNNFNFHIESSALSSRKLIQKHWDTKPSDVLEEGFQWVNTIKLHELREKYKINFDTLVLDCEGAFYYILLDTPEILKNINLVIMENDYWDISHKEYVDDILIKQKFNRIYVESGGWGPCYDNFFEVWKK